MTNEGLQAPMGSGRAGRGGDDESLRERLQQAVAPELEILRRLGRGSMAEVYLAREPALRRLVAVKVLLPELAGDRTARLRFAREAGAAASIVHPNVLAVHRVESLDGELPYLVMQYVKGRTLEDVLAVGQTFDPEEGRRILRQIAAALAAAHARGVVHRDLKPANVLHEEESGAVFLADFGIAAILASGSEAVERLTTTGVLLQDPTYASPEQLMGEEPTEATDIYSFGVLGYHVLAGRGPYDGATSQQISIAHLRHEPRPLGALRTGAPPDLEELLLACLAKNPRARPNARELSRRLEARPEPEAVATSVTESPVRHHAPAGPATRVGGAGRLFRELKRRHVFRVAVVYGLVAWLLVQVAETTFPSLGIPAWALTLVIVMAISGFPIALLLAWAFEVTPDGVRKTRLEEPPDAS